MIVPEHILRDDVVANIAAIRINENFTLKPKFGWGDKKELNRWLAKKKHNDIYPLIWLLPSADKHIRRGKAADKDCELIFATLESKKDLFNDERYIRSFDVVLRPLLIDFFTQIKLSATSGIVTHEWETFSYPNYSEADKNGTIELWDAISLSIKINFTKKSNFL